MSQAIKLVPVLTHITITESIPVLHATISVKLVQLQPPTVLFVETIEIARLTVSAVQGTMMTQ